MRGFRGLSVSLLAVALMVAAGPASGAPAAPDKCTLDLSDPETPRIGLHCLSFPDLLDPSTLLLQRNATLLVLSPAGDGNITTVWDPANQTVSWVMRATQTDGTYIETLIRATIGCLTAMGASESCSIVFQETRGREE